MTGICKKKITYLEPDFHFIFFLLLILYLTFSLSNLQVAENKIQITETKI